MVKLALAFFFAITCLHGRETVTSTIKYYDTDAIKAKYFPRSNDNFGVVNTKQGNYQIFVSKMGNVGEGEKNEIFFGTLSDYYKKYSEEYQKIQAKEGGIAGAATALQANSSLFASGGAEVLKAGLSGFGIGAVYAIITPIVEKSLTDEQYISVSVFSKNKKEIGRVSSIFISDDDEFTEEEIKSMIKEKEKSKGVKND